MMTFQAVEGKTLRAAECARDELVLEMERKGGAFGTNVTVEKFTETLIAYKEASDTGEPSTISGYRTESRWITRQLVSITLGKLGIPQVNTRIADLTQEGYAPKTVSEAFRLLKQARKKFAQA